MSPLSPLISRRVGRFAPVLGYWTEGDDAPTIRVSGDGIRQFLTAFAGGFVFFSILIF